MYLPLICGRGPVGRSSIRGRARTQAFATVAAGTAGCRGLRLAEGLVLVANGMLRLTLMMRENLLSWNGWGILTALVRDSSGDYTGTAEERGSWGRQRRVAGEVGGWQRRGQHQGTSSSSLPCGSVRRPWFERPAGRAQASEVSLRKQTFHLRQ